MASARGWRLPASAALALLALLGSGGVALAHGGPPPQPAQIWSAWSFDPVLLAALALAAWVYVRGLGRIWARAGAGRGVRRWQAEAFLAGLATIFVALVSPLDGLSSALFSVHMLQHLLLVLVAAPLLVLGAPLAPILWALPLAWRRRLGRWARHGPLHGAWHILQRPFVAWALQLAALWLWHIPALYDAALRNQAIHSLEHAIFLATALLFWHVLFHLAGSRRFGYGAATAYAFTAGLVMMPLGIILTFLPSPIYSAYGSASLAWGVSPLADQQAGGLIMWIPASGVYLVAGLAMLARWVSAAEREQQRRERTPASASDGEPRRSQTPALAGELEPRRAP